MSTGWEIGAKARAVIRTALAEAERHADALPEWWTPALERVLNDLTLDPCTDADDVAKSRQLLTDDDESQQGEQEPVCIVFDRPPSHEAGRFVEVEQGGKSIRYGEWRERDDGFWELVLPRPPVGLPHELSTLTPEQRDEILYALNRRIDALTANLDHDETAERFAGLSYLAHWIEAQGQKT